MDRGYVSYERMEKWVTNKIDFVMRLANKHLAVIQMEHDLPAGKTNIVRDATVILGKQPKTKMETKMKNLLRLIAMVTYGLTYLVKSTLKAPKTNWEILRLIRFYALKHWSAFLEASS